MKKFIKLGFILLSFGFLVKCSTPTDPVTGEKVLIEPNVGKRSREAAEKSGGIMNILGKSQENTNFSFATSNVLWRATLKSLSFMPLLNADYSGGVIITDWYSENINSDEQIKITIRFLNNEIRADSLDVIAHKKKCDINNKCSQTLLGNSFSKEIKDSILTIARQIKIEEEKSKKN